MSNFTLKVYKRERRSIPHNSEGLFVTTNTVHAVDYVEVAHLGEVQCVTGYTNAGAVVVREDIPTLATSDDCRGFDTVYNEFVVIENMAGKTTQIVKAAMPA